MNQLQLINRCKKATRILLYGPPGTGKTTMGYKLAAHEHRPVYGLTVNNDISPASLLGFWGLRGGETQFIDGPATQALANGGILILNEIGDIPPSCETILMSLLDDPGIVAVPIPDGRILKPAAGYRVVCTQNDNPSCLRAALLDRFDLILEVSEPSEQQLDTLSAGPRKYLKNWYSKRSKQAFTRPISFRAFQAFEMLQEYMTSREAAEITFGENASDILTSINLEAK